MKNIIVELSFQVGVGTYKVKFHNNQQGCPQVGLSRVCAQPRTDLPNLGGREVDPPLTTGNHRSSRFRFGSVTIFFGSKQKRATEEILMLAVEISMDLVEIWLDLDVSCRDLANPSRFGHANQPNYCSINPKTT